MIVLVIFKFKSGALKKSGYFDLKLLLKLELLKEPLMMKRKFVETKRKNHLRGIYVVTEAETTNLTGGYNYVEYRIASY